MSKQRPIKIEIDPDVADGVTLASLKFQLRCLTKPKYPSKHPEDIAMEKELIAAHKLLINYYGPAR